MARKSMDFMNPKPPIGYHDLNQPKVSKTKICICDDGGTPIKAVPSRVRARRQVANPFEEREEPPFVGLPDMARIGQISIAELTGKTKYDVNMDPFACSDVTVVKVLDGGKSRVVDAFAQSKYGLEPDEFFGGEQSFVDISASEENGEATVLIRRPIRAADVADHTIMPGNTQIFWANGPPGNSPVRISGAAHIETMFLDFYNTTVPVIADLDEDETLTTVIAYTTPRTEAPVEVHTVKVVEAVPVTQATQATEETETTELPFVIPETTETITTVKVPIPQITESNVIDENDSGEHEVVEPVVHSGETSSKPTTFPDAEIAACHGSYVYPPQCNENCVYAVSWQTDGANAHFNLWAKLKPQMWSGIGFSTQGTMVRFRPLTYITIVRTISDERRCRYRLSSRRFLCYRY